MKKITAFTLLSLAAVLTFAQCGKPDPGSSSGGGGTATELTGDQKSNHFEAVHQHLDLGGILYAYLDIDSDLANLAESLGEMIIAGLEGRGDLEEMPPFFRRADNWALLVKELGLDSLKAAGLSSHKDGDLFHNKVYLHFPEGREGVFKILGGEPKPFLARELAPADTDFIFERELNLNAAYEAVLKVASHFPDLAKEMLETAQEPVPMPGLQMTTGELIRRLDTRIVVMIRLNPDERLPVPIPIELPMIEAAIGFEKMGWLYDSMKSTMPLDSVPGFETESSGGADWIVVPDEMQNPRFRPAFYSNSEKDLVLAGTSRAFLEECLGDGPKVGSSDSFKAAMKGLPEEGNGLNYMTPRVMQTIWDVIEKGMAGGGAGPVGLQELTIMEMWLPRIDEPMGDVSVNLEQGVLLASNSYQSHKSTMLMTANPTALAILASIGMPAYSQMQVQAGQVKETSVVRQLVLACRAYAADHDGAFPPNLQALVSEGIIDRPEMLMWTNPQTNQTGEYLYTPGLNDTSFSRMILIAAPESVVGKRVVGYVGGQVMSVPELQYRQEVAENENRQKQNQ